MEAGRKVTPCCQRPASIVSIIQMGSDGSSIAMPVLANVIAPGGVAGNTNTRPVRKLSFDVATTKIQVESTSSV